MSYNLLKKLLANGSVFHIHSVKFIAERLLRMLPLYIFLIFFLWQFMSLIGGEGPMFLFMGHFVIGFDYNCSNNLNFNK
jgi:hypothetical protein